MKSITAGHLVCLFLKFYCESPLYLSFFHFFLSFLSFLHSFLDIYLATFFINQDSLEPYHLKPGRFIPSEESTVLEHYFQFCQEIKCYWQISLKKEKKHVLSSIWHVLQFMRGYNSAHLVHF